MLFSLWGNLVGQTETISGEKLSLTFCGGCHQFPEPSLLDRQTWTSAVLPKMGWRLGIRNNRSSPYEELEPDEAERVKASGIYPDKPMISPANWQKIIAYYQMQAPEKLPEIQHNPRQTYSLDTLFRPVPVSFGEGRFPRVSMLEFDSMSGKLYIGDAGKELFVLNGDLQLGGYWMLNGPPADILFRRGRAPRLLSVGSIAPTEIKNGHLFTLDSTASGRTDDRPLENLARPVHLASADLDVDGTPDEVLCEFGHHTGQLSVFLSASGKQILKEGAGARKSIPADLDRDGRVDLVVLWAQAKESVIWFRNLGSGQFEEKELLSFHPLFGASDLHLADMNGDSVLELILTNGDNWDLSPIRKPYHGVSIFEQKGRYQYARSYFYPMYGASKAVILDADLDGRMDLAAVSFYDQADDPSTSFVLLKNKGNLNFDAHVLSNLPTGKWLNMDTGDIDDDGDMDIFLGSYFHNAVEVTKVAAGGAGGYPHVVILYNDHRR